MNSVRTQKRDSAIYILHNTPKASVRCFGNHPKKNWVALEERKFTLQKRSVMLLLSISIWIIVVYSVKVFAMGNPAYILVKEVPGDLLNQAMDCLESEIMPDDEIVYLFIKKFFRLTALACLLFIVEFAIALYFIFEQPNFYVAWFILTKNIFMLIVGYKLHKNSSGNIFEAVQQIPHWAMLWERISYLISAACFLFFFLRINNLLN